MSPHSAQSDDEDHTTIAATSAVAAPSEPPRWLAVYVIVRHPGRDPYWLSVGKAFVNADGSLNVRLDANPIDGKLHIRPPPQSHSAGPATAPNATAAVPKTSAARGVSRQR